MPAVFGTLTKNWGWLLALGIVSIALGTIGLYMTFALTLASGVLTLVLAGTLMAVGVIRITMGIQHRQAATGWYWSVLSGILSILLGAMIVLQWPVSGLWVIGLFVAVELMFSGWSYLFFALAARKAGREEPAAA